LLMWWSREEVGPMQIPLAMWGGVIWEDVECSPPGPFPACEHSNKDGEPEHQRGEELRPKEDGDLTPKSPFRT
jgi:hypothetical protein